jgi:23S rRNA (cytidine1920-2'-O)/16S rRNA (cytidine1409-2'-O)-methyltransferase
MERTNARTLGPEVIPEPIALAVVDVSFISLGLVLPPIVRCLGPEGRVVPLVKPQFEAGRSEARGGVVRDPAVHRAVLDRVAVAAEQAGLGVVGVAASPILGPEGNREFLLDLRLRRPSDSTIAARFADLTGAERG